MEWIPVVKELPKFSLCEGGRVLTGNIVFRCDIDKTVHLGYAEKHWVDYKDKISDYIIRFYDQWGDEWENVSEWFYVPTAVPAPTSGRPIFDPDKAEEHITKLYEQYRDDANRRFIQDNEGRSKESQVFSPEYYKVLGMQLATSDILEFFAKFDFPREAHE